MKHKEVLKYLAIFGISSMLAFSIPTSAYATEQAQNEQGVEAELYASTEDLTISQNMRLTQDLTVQGDLYLTGGLLNLDGYTLTVEGNLYQTGGTLSVNKGTVDIGKDYLIAKKTVDSLTDEVTYSSVYAYLKMTNDEDVVKIGGDFLTYTHTGNGNNSLTAGTMYVGGNFTQMGSNTNYYSNFNSTGTHTVELNGTREQVISFDVPYGYSQFANLRMAENHSGDVIITGYFNCDALQSDIKVKSAVINNINLNGKTFEVMEDLTIRRSGTINLKGGVLQVNGNLNHLSGTINVNKGTLDIKGNYLMAEKTIDSLTERVTYSNVHAYLKMTNAEDVVKVGGDFLTYTHTGNGNNSLTAGTMYVGGNFTQMGSNTNYYSNFNPTETHVVELNGTETQNIVFQNEDCKFNTLRVVNDINNCNFEPYGCWNTLIKIPKVERVAITADDYSVKQGKTLQLNARVTGINDPTQSVIWKLEGNESPETTISSTGLLSVSREEALKEITLTATSSIDETKSATVTITILDGSIENPFEDVAEDQYYYEPVLWALDQSGWGCCQSRLFSQHTFQRKVGCFSKSIQCLFC